LKIIINSNL